MSNNTLNTNDNDTDTDTDTDTNIDNYTIEELFAIIGLEQEFCSDQDIVNSVVRLKQQIDDADLVTFLENIQQRLLDYTSIILDENQPYEAETEPEPEKKIFVNPIVKTTISRLISFDSQCRQDSETATNFIAQLKEPILNALSLRLYSYSIPYSFYNVNSPNNIFWLEDFFNNLYEIVIVPGRYTSELLANAISELLIPFQGTAVYNGITGKITFSILDSNMSRIVFSTSSTSTSLSTSSLGYMLGFRTLSTSLTGTSDAVADLIYPKYLILDIDDYNQIYIIASLAVTKSSQPNTKIAIASSICSDRLFGFPRQYTRAQIYAITEIEKNNNKKVIDDDLENNKCPNTDFPSPFAIMPFKHNDSISYVNTEFGGSLQENKRIYSGPVTLSRFKIKLYDDRGNIVDLNGNDWSFVLMSEIMVEK
jgi:hypothetical protein